MSTGTAVRKLPMLTDDEQERFARLESEIRPALGNFLDVAERLYEIARDRLYRDTHDSFEHYLDARWGLSRSWGNQLVKAHKAVLALPEGADRPTSVRAALAVAKGTTPAVVPGEDPAVTWGKANGVIPADAEVTTVRPEGSSNLGPAAAGNGGLSGPTDEEWLATLPARAKVCERLRPLFDSEALTYRDLGPAREAYRKAYKPLTDALKKEHGGRVGPWLAVHSLHLKIDDPADWRECSDCEGQGIFALTKEKCGSCKGNGYHVR